MPTIFMFSGQGSQYFQMGKPLFEYNSCYREWMNEIDDLFKQELGESILHIIYNPECKKTDIFDRTLYTHPAIFMVEFALAKALIKNGIFPDYVLGASLGEYTAATLAGVICLEDAVNAISKQAQVLDSLGNNGSMLAILHNVSLYFDTPLLRENTDIAGINFDQHFVISGENDSLTEIIQYLKEKNIMYQLLPVSQGFHSFILDSFAWDYISYLNTLDISTPKIPVISSSRASLIDVFTPDYFWEVVRNPIEFQKTISFIESTIDHNNKVYIDLGPSGTMATFTKYIIGSDINANIFSIITPFSQDVENFNKVERYLNNLN